MSNIIDLNRVAEKFTNMNLAQWIEFVDEVDEGGLLQLEEVRKQIEPIATKEDIRYKYFAKCYASAIMHLESEQEDYEALRTRFWDFKEAILNYYLDIFQESAFAGEMEMIPAEARAAVVLHDMFSKEESDWEGKLADLKRCTKEYPRLRVNIKRMVRFIGEKMKEEEAEKSENVNQELLEMVELMKDKIRILSQQGMQVDALSVLSQVRGFAPADRELARMEDELTGRLNEKKILLTISLLCSGRSETTIKCLESLEAIREQIPCEVIIVDTGCSKKLRCQLTKYADIITSFTWCNDFAKVRNAGLALARGEWFLYIDDDEWFSDCEELIAFFSSGKYKNYGAATYIQRNYLDMQGSQYTDSWVSRMIKLDKDTRFESRIHEYLTPIKGNSCVLHSVVEHYGYVYETEKALMAHYERNSSLLKMMIEEEPEELRWYMLLAQEYRTVCMWQELYDLGTDALALTKGKTGLDISVAIGCFYGAQILAMKEIARSYAANKDNCNADVCDIISEDGDVRSMALCCDKKGLELCKTALVDSRNTELFRAFCALWMSWFAYWTADYTMAIEYGTAYFDWMEYFADKEDILSVQRVAPFVADCFDIVMKKQVYSILICAGIRIGDVEYLEKYLDKLEWDKKQVYVFEDIIPTLIEVKAEDKTQKKKNKAFEKVMGLIQNHGPLKAYYNSILNGV